MKNILIIGSRGFTGRYVKEVFAKDPDMTIHEGYSYDLDIRDKSSIAKTFDAAQPDVVINIAAVSTLSVDDIPMIYEMNATAVVNLLEELKDRKFEGRFITSSSAYVYGNNTPEIICEEQRLYPENQYSVAKITGESACKLYRDDFDALVVRPFNCIGMGHGDTFLIPKIVRHFVDKKDRIELGNIKARRDYVDIRDIARMYYQVACAEKVDSIYNFCSGQANSIQNLLDIMNEVSGHSIEVDINQAFIRANDNLYMQGGIERLEKIGFKHKYSLTDTLTWMYEEMSNQEIVSWAVEC